MQHSSDTTAPASARIWNYWLGGDDHYPVDREAGEAFCQVCPGMVEIARAERAFLVETVTFLAEHRGVRQFLDIGSGLPTENHTHEVARAAAPGARTVYVDHDPLVLEHARALLEGTDPDTTAYLDADVHAPAEILERASATLDLSEPVGLVMLGIVGHIADPATAHAVLDRLTSALAPGSHLVLCDGTNVHDPAYHRATDQWNSTDGALGYHLRSPDEVAAFFRGTGLVEPGVVPTPMWQEPEVGTGRPKVLDLYGAVGRIGAARHG